MLIFAGFYCCEPTMPDYDIEKSKNMLVVSSVLSPGNPNQIFHISKTDLFESLPQEDLNEDSLKMIVNKNGNEYIAQPDSIIEWYGRFYYYLNLPLKPHDRVAVNVIHPDYETIRAEVEIPDSVHCAIPVNDTLFYEMPEYLSFSWSEVASAEAYFVKIYLSATNNDSNDFDIQLNNDYYHLLPLANVQTKCFYIISREEIIDCLKNVIQKVNSYRYWDENKISLKLSDYESVSLYAKIFSLDENAIYIFEESKSQDELSGFNTKIELYSNVENGRGVICAYSKTRSKNISFSKNLIEQCLNVVHHRKVWVDKEMI